MHDEAETVGVCVGRDALRSDDTAGRVDRFMVVLRRGRCHHDVDSVAVRQRPERSERSISTVLGSDHGQEKEARPADHREGKVVPR